MTLEKEISYSNMFCRYEKDEIVAGQNGIKRWTYKTLDGPLCEMCSNPIEDTEKTGKRCKICFGKDSSFFSFERVYVIGPFYARSFSQLSDHIYSLKVNKIVSIPLGMALSLLIEHKYPILKNSDCIIPVPVHQNDIIRKGFNHVAELGKIVCHFTKIPLELDVLVKTKDEKIKEGTWKERREHVRDLYKNNKKISGNVILLDDIFTTGSTSTVCAEKLIESGAKSVNVLAVGRKIFEGEQR